MDRGGETSKCSLRFVLKCREQRNAIMLRFGSVVVNGVLLSALIFLAAAILAGFGLDPSATWAIEAGTALSGFGFSAAGIAWAIYSSIAERAEA